jgi:hypothetical protein
MRDVDCWSDRRSPGLGSALPYPQIREHEEQNEFLHGVTRIIQYWEVDSENLRAARIRDPNAAHHITQP